MAYVVRTTTSDDTIFGNMATLGGHVSVEDFANISAGSGVHQFCRVGRHAFVGGYSVVTKDALPFARTVGSRPARIFGVNTIGLVRRGVAPDVIAKLRRSFRYLLKSKLNTTNALRQMERDRSLSCAEVDTCSTSSGPRSAASSSASLPARRRVLAEE
jgi:UDP-N-acetylglucosamine acyltransferase